MSNVIKLSDRFKRQMDSLVVTKEDISIAHLKDGSKTAVYGGWILIRRWPSGRELIVMKDAPNLIYTAAREKLDDQVWTIPQNQK